MTPTASSHASVSSHAVVTLRASLALPLVVPMLLGYSLSATDAGGILRVLATWLVVSLFVVGPVYLIFANLVLLWSMRKSERTLRRAALCMPLIFAALLVLLDPSGFSFDPTRQLTIESLRESTWIGLLAVPIGYAYVGLAFLLCALVARQTPAAQTAT